MTRDKFKQLTGEDPIDMFGEDGWEEAMEEYVYSEEGNEHFHDGHLVGGCFQCKMD